MSTDPIIDKDASKSKEMVEVSKCPQERPLLAASIISFSACCFTAMIFIIKLIYIQYPSITPFQTIFYRSLTPVVILVLQIGIK